MIQLLFMGHDNVCFKDTHLEVKKGIKKKSMYLKDNKSLKFKNIEYTIFNIIIYTIWFLSACVKDANKIFFFLYLNVVH